MSPQKPCEACRCRRGSRRSVHAPGQGAPPPPGDSRRHRHRYRGVPPLAHSLPAHFHAAARPTSATDPIMNMSALDHSRCDQLAWYLWPRRRARRALPGKAGRRHPALCAGLNVASPPTGQGVPTHPPCVACRCRRGARCAIHPLGHCVPPPQGDSRRRRHGFRGVPPPAHSLSACFQETGCLKLADKPQCRG